MSATYLISGYIDVRIPIVGETFNCSQSCTHDEIAKGFIEMWGYRIGSLQHLDHKLHITEI